VIDNHLQPPPPAQDVSQAPDQRKQEAQRARREWQEGLRAHIRGQRCLSATPSQPSTPTAAAAVADAAPAQPTGLTWDEIKLAANEGFENLVKKIEMEQFMAGDEPRRQQRAAYKTKNKPTAGINHKILWKLEIDIKDSHNLSQYLLQAILLLACHNVVSAIVGSQPTSKALKCIWLSLLHVHRPGAYSYQVVTHVRPTNLTQP
jgi:hypothetical protein